MRAILFDRFGGPEVLYMGTLDKPIPQAGELLVRVQASALNRADILQRKGQYPAPAGDSTVLGLELAGEVVEVGAGVTKWKPGDAVCGLVGGGGYAEYAILQEGMALPIPLGWTWEMAAAIPEAFMTAWQSLSWIGQLQAGARVLIHAGASGVGTAAIQISRALGAEVWVTASASKHTLCKSLGAFACIDYKTTDFGELLDASKPGSGVDVVVDCIGAPYFEKNIQVLRRDGRMIILAMMGGSVVESFNLMPILAKRLSINGSTLRNRSQGYKMRLAQDLYKVTWPLFLDGTLKPVVDRTFLFSEVVDAHIYMEQNLNQGKIILRQV